MQSEYSKYLTTNWQNFPWIKAMKGVQQEKEFHAEGDVFAHTEMVCEALIKDQEFKEHARQDIMLRAALLHDVGKPKTTIFQNGKWTSPNHSRVGETIARSVFFNKDLITDFYSREYICKLVRHHGLPLRFLDKKDPERVLTEVSQHVRLADLALLARADVIGRTCESQDELLCKIELFEELAKDLDCYNIPRRFESSHHRFMWSIGHKEYRYVPYDDTKMLFTMMCGLPGSGKSTWIKKNSQNRPVVSLDEIRRENKIDPADSKRRDEVIRIANEQAKELLRKGISFIWDATNVIKDIRSAIISMAATYKAKIEIVYIECDKDKMLSQNKNRQHVVPESVIENMFNKLEMPTSLECHNIKYIIC